MAIENLYLVLGIPDHSDVALVKKAFRQLALKYHPDRNSEAYAEEKFKTIARAYEILNDPITKQSYDNRLKLGIDIDRFDRHNGDTEREDQKKWYARMRKEQDAIREVENITAYEKSLTWFPILWRFIIIGFFLLTGCVFILNDWYQKGNKIAFGGILFIVASLVLWNELYKFYWHRSLTLENPGTVSYERISSRLFLKVFFGGLIMIFGLIKIKKAWHLHYFSKEIYARVEEHGNYISYSYNDSVYLMEIFSTPEKTVNKQVLIRISTKEPEIWEYVD